MFNQEDLNKLNEYTFAFLEVEHTDNVLTITLNRPEKKNALHPVTANELAFALTYAKQNKDVWAVVIKANGDVFCAGADLQAFMTGGGETNTTVPKADGEILIGELFNQLHKPCIAQVEGDAFAGAFLLLAGCTQVVAASNVKFGLPEVKRGLFPFQVMASLLQVMPERKALDWCIQGYTLDAQKAAYWGLVTHIAEPGKVADTVQRMIDVILDNSPTAIRMGLEAYQHIRSVDTKAQHSYLQGMLMKTVQTKDAQEGIMAFREKREPKWSNE
ncbi:MAG: enoyl-CoA hydratase/isomerase family protein [Flavobacteriales bacterium]|nr:enoyl-CoA hydratase/isomerase family protein [Flavobacteriales bacterium]